MALVNLFRNIKKYYNISSLSNQMFSICNVSACNYNKKSLFLQPIYKTPTSFDSAISPNSEKERPRNSLQNGFKFLNGLLYNEKFEFIGQTFNKSKTVWIKYDFAGQNNTVITFLFNFNLSESFYTLKTTVKSIWKNTALQNTVASSIEKRILKNATKPGEKLTISLKKNDRDHEIGVNQFTFLLPTDLRNLLLIQYGGNWIMSSAKLMKGRMYNYVWTKDSESPYQMFPTFDIPKPSISSTCNISINSTLKYNYIGDRPSTYFPTTMPPLFLPHKIDLNLKQSEIIEYEIRENLCPNSNLIKIQIENIYLLNNTIIFNSTFSMNISSFSITIWKRINSIWSFVESVKKEAQIYETNNNLSFFSNAFTFSCNNYPIYSFNQYSSSTANIKANYVVEGILQKLNCNIKC